MLATTNGASLEDCLTNIFSLRSVCSQLTLVILFILQSQQLHIACVKGLEYSSVEERIDIVESLIKEDQHHHHHHHQQQQQQQQQDHNHNQQQQQQLYSDEHHRSLADSMQQVLLDSPRQPYHHYAHTRVAWKHESTIDGELSEFYMGNFESSYPVMSQENQLVYYQYHHIQQHQHLQKQYQHHQHNHQHLQQQNQQLQQHHHYHQQQYDEIIAPIFDRPLQSCNSHNPSILMQNDLAEPPTCKASLSSTDTAAASPSAGGSSGNVPNFSHLNNHNSNIESFPLSQQHYHYESSLIGAIRHYWKEVSCLCLASAIFLNWLFVVIKRRFVRAAGHINDSHKQATTKSISKDTNSSSAHDSAFEETASPLNLEDNDTSSDDHVGDKSTESAQIFNTSSNIRQRSSTLKAEPIPIPTSPAGHNSQPNSLSTSPSNNFEYNSRYSSDFDSIQRLGRGGFGIVFEARNKIDDCHYAVKRICLPLEKEARERVMREVRALAKLDHAGIVRYYNAWLETPPEDWLKQHDAQLGIVHSKDGLSFPSTDGIYERNESEHITKGGGGGKLGESGDNSSGLFGNSPFKRRKNGFHKFLKNNSSSPSLDIVFEGSGSIRLESKNNTEKTDSLEEDDENNVKMKENRRHNDHLPRCKNGDNNSDSEDSDFIKFESKSNSANEMNDIVDEISISSHLTEPFSSSSSGSSSRSNEGTNNHADGPSRNNNAEKKFNVETDKKKALIYQKELKRLNNRSLADNLHVEKAYLYIQMQLCRKDTLKDWLKTNCEQRDKTTIFDLFYQIVDAVEYVHSQDLIHRDLKPSNIFFSLDGTLKIGDFGLCRAKTSTGIGSSLDLQEYVAESDVERGFEAVHTEQVGTQLYMSPEQLNGLSYNQKVDIFAMGLILLELLIPFKTQMQRVNVLFKARNNLYSDEFRKEYPQEHELVRSLLSRSPLKRPTASEIKQHELLASAQLSQPVIERIYHRRRTISSNSSTE